MLLFLIPTLDKPVEGQRDWLCIWHPSAEAKRSWPLKLNGWKIWLSSWSALLTLWNKVTEACHGTFKPYHQTTEGLGEAYGRAKSLGSLFERPSGHLYARIANSWEHARVGWETLNEIESKCKYHIWIPNRKQYILGCTLRKARYWHLLLRKYDGTIDKCRQRLTSHGQGRVQKWNQHYWEREGRSTEDLADNQ